MTVTRVDVVPAGTAVDVVAKIDVSGMGTEEALSVPRTDVPGLLKELGPFLTPPEWDEPREVTVQVGGSQYRIWNPERSEQPMLCILNMSMVPNPPQRIKSTVSIPYAMLSQVIDALRAAAPA
jgi:hypothetical protein